MPKSKYITVTGVEVSRFQRLTFAKVAFVPGSGLVRITGRNGSGKTSLLRSIRAALGGAGEVLADPIEDGSEDGSGEVRLQLSNGFTVRRRFTEAQPKGYLTVEGPDGGRHAQRKLDEWLGPLSFDPLAYFDLRPDRQREILLSLGDPTLPSQLAEIRSERAERYEERTPWISQQRSARRIERPAGERPDPVDVSGELKRMGELQAMDRDLGDARRNLTLATDAVRNRLEVVERQRANVARLEEALARAREAVEEAEAEHDAALAREEAAQEALEEMSDPRDEMDEVRERISAADRVQAELEPWRRYDRAQEEEKEASAEVERLTSAIEALDNREKELIRDAGIPVEGLSFAEDGSPLLNGHPLEVASGAERIRLAVGVALAADPELRICLVDEANDVDLDGMKALDELAKEHGFQIWAARLGLEGAGEIVVDDGRAWDRDSAEEAAA